MCRNLVLLFCITCICYSCSYSNLIVEGKIKDISMSVQNDIVVKLENNDTLYYINRGGENLKADSLSCKLNRKYVLLYVDEHNSILGKGYRIRQINVNDSCIFKD